MNDEQFHNRVGHKRITDRQVDEFVGLARGLCADGVINAKEVEYLQKWAAANATITNHLLIHALYERVSDILSDNYADTDECRELFDALQAFSNDEFELGEPLKSTKFPLCNPAPTLSFIDQLYCLTGTFSFGKKALCEQAIHQKGGKCGTLTKATNVLVIGEYATESWKHSNQGNKIIRAVEMRESGTPIAIVSEAYWCSYL